MFKLKNGIWNSLVCSLMVATLLLASCSSDDNDMSDDMNNEDCTPNYVSQVVTGQFMGDAFTMVEGTATEDFADNTAFRIVLYGESVTGDACDGFNFEKPDSSIIFSVPMEVGSYDLGISYSLTFNDASVTNEVNAVVSICGAIEIISVSDSEVTGKLDVTGDEESFLNGNFTVTRCP